jgi:hypothetical protein
VAQLLLDNMQGLHSFQQDDSLILGSIPIGDVCADQVKIECYVKGIVNASNFLHSYPLMSYRLRDQIAQQIFDAAKVENEVCFTGVFNEFIVVFRVHF